ncbi:hypothetical protein HOF78_00380 [Candidatus Woesearchaeota archaeon]|jgi:hypothetical protein|nr:hypothetical protein [Candidatus Woesearchaeota archaeon]MBT6044577.1 hypothetical protein [Candidatus Woesearchaeota archaeon]
MLNKRGGVGPFGEQTGASLVEVMIFLIFIGIVLGAIAQNDSIDRDSLSSFGRLDGVIREKAMVIGSEDVVPISMDSDYALVLFDKKINSCEGKKILKPENKCKDRACLCLCEIGAKSEMCAIASARCLTYTFDLTEDCSYFKGQSSPYTLHVMNLKGNISVSTERIDPLESNINIA